MKMHLEGSFEVDVPQEKVYAFVSDPKQIGQCIPDLESLESTSAAEFMANVKVGVGLARGTVAMKGTISEKNPPSHAKLTAEGSGIGSNMKLESVFDLTKVTEGRTQMRWRADAEVGGLIAGIGAKLLQKNAEKQIAEIFDRVKLALEKSV